jgi:hypothetical protein
MLSKRVLALARNRGLMIPRSTVGMLATPQYWCVSSPVYSHPYHARIRPFHSLLLSLSPQPSSFFAHFTEVTNVLSDRIHVLGSPPAVPSFTRQNC